MPIVYSGATPNPGTTPPSENLRHDLMRGAEAFQTDIASYPDDSAENIQAAYDAFYAWLVANGIDPS